MADCGAVYMLAPYVLLSIKGCEFRLPSLAIQPDAWKEWHSNSPAKQPKALILEESGGIQLPTTEFNHGGTSDAPVDLRKETEYFFPGGAFSPSVSRRGMSLSMRRLIVVTES